MNDPAAHVMSITIDAPVEEVFLFLSEPENRLKVWPSLLKVEDVCRNPTGGCRYRFTFNLGDGAYRGTCTDVQCIDCRSITVQITGGIRGTVSYAFTPEGSGTNLTVTTNYTLAPPLLPELAKSVIATHCRNELTILLANIKKMIEQ